MQGLDNCNLNYQSYGTGITNIVSIWKRYVSIKIKLLKKKKPPKKKKKNQKKRREKCNSERKQHFLG
jgi:hypothetical protein